MEEYWRFSCACYSRLLRRVQFRQQAEPLDHSSLPVAHSLASSEEPAVHAVGAPDAIINFHELAGCKCLAPDGEDSFRILGVERGKPTRTLGLLQRQPGEVGPELVGVVDGA